MLTKLYLAAGILLYVVLRCDAEPPVGYENAPRIGDIPAEAETSRIEDLSPTEQARLLDLEKRCLPRFRSLVAAELSCLGRLCVLDSERQRALRNNLDEALPQVVRRFALIQTWTGARDRRTDHLMAPRRLVGAAVARAVSQELHADQAAKYQREVARRGEYRKSVSIKAIVAAIDRRLVLSTEQRDRLALTLAQNWLDVWDKVIPNSINGAGQLPGIPDQHLVPLLTPAQVKAWRLSRKHSFAVPLTLDLGQLPVVVGELDDVGTDSVEAGENDG